MPDPKTEDRSAEMEHDLGELDDHIADARKKLAERKDEAGIVEEAAGEPTGPQDASGGEDAEGSGDDVRGADEDGTHDGASGDDGDGARGPASDGDGPEPEEYASPT